MLTTPDNENRPLFAAKDINKFYFEHSPKILPKNWNFVSSITCLFGELMGPKYDGKYLWTLTSPILGDKTLKKIVTNVLIPTFDIKLLQLVIFSTNDAKENVLKNARLADVCINTSAAPTYFPAHHFEIKDDDGSGEIHSFDLVDGGVAANNPPHFKGDLQAQP